MLNVAPWSWPSESRAVSVTIFAAGFTGALILIQIDPWAGIATQVGLGAALGGAASNIFDRLRFGAVRDFLWVGWGGIFNPADAALVLGLLTVLASHIQAAHTFIPHAS